MNSSAPTIGFDRFIQPDWAAAALNVRAGTADLDELSALLDASTLGAAAKKKTRTVLNRLWLTPRSHAMASSLAWRRLWTRCPCTRSTFNEPNSVSLQALMLSGHA